MVKKSRIIDREKELVAIENAQDEKRFGSNIELDCTSQCSDACGD